MKLDHWIKRATFAALAGIAVLVATTAGAATAPALGTAESFAVLAGTTVTNTGLTTITGDLGVSPGSAIADSGTITLTGATHVADAVALQAQNDVTTAYNALGGEPCTASFVGTDVEIGGQTLIPGVYCYSSSAILTGTLILNGDGVFIFKTGSTLTTASGSTVALIGGAQPCNVFWQVGSSADLFTTTTFIGNILALTSINLQTGASLAGRALARNGAVTLDANTISAPVCAAAATPTATATDTPTFTPVPPTATFTPGLGTPTLTPAPATATSTPSAAATDTPTATSTLVAATPTDTPVAAAPTDTPIAATLTSTPVVVTPTDTPTAVTPTATPGTTTATPTPDTATPAATLDTTTPTSTAVAATSTATRPRGSAPASPIETPDVPSFSPGAPRLPDTGNAPAQGRDSWPATLVTLALASFAVGSGLLVYGRRAR